MSLQQTCQFIPVNAVSQLAKAFTDVPPCGPRIVVVSSQQDFIDEIYESIVRLLESYASSFSKAFSAPVMFVFDLREINILTDILRSSTSAENSPLIREALDSFFEALKVRVEAIWSKSMEVPSKEYLVNLHNNLKQLVRSPKYKCLALSANRIALIRSIFRKVEIMLKENYPAW